MGCCNHFQGKDPIEHVAEARARGMIASSELHGTEISGHYSAGADAAKEMALISLTLWVFLPHMCIPSSRHLVIYAIFAIGWSIWRSGRGAWLAWSRLERLHRIIREEKYEIEHHRDEEREELMALYATKGFRGKLLEEVVQVLMADDNRLLRVMVEEELGLSLGVHEHPLKQGFGAAVGVIASVLLTCLGYIVWPAYGVPIASLLAIGIAAGIYSALERNRTIPAIVWNIGLGCLTSGCVYFLLDYALGGAA